MINVTECDVVTVGVQRAHGPMQPHTGGFSGAEDARYHMGLLNAEDVLDEPTYPLYYGSPPPP